MLAAWGDERSVLVEEVAEESPGLMEEVGAAGLLWMEVAERPGSLVGNGPGREAGARSDLGKAEDWKRAPVPGGGGRVCPAGVAGARSL